MKNKIRWEARVASKVREREREHGMRHELCIWNIIMTEYDRHVYWCSQN